MSHTCRVSDACQLLVNSHSSLVTRHRRVSVTCHQSLITSHSPTCQLLVTSHPSLVPRQRVSYLSLVTRHSSTHLSRAPIPHTRHPHRQHRHKHHIHQTVEQVRLVHEANGHAAACCDAVQDACQLLVTGHVSLVACHVSRVKDARQLLVTSHLLLVKDARQLLVTSHLLLVKDACQWLVSRRLSKKRVSYLG